MRGLPLKAPLEGFTLIELLVVMSILGILATGTMVAINPAEQIHRAQDSNTKGIAVEYAKATARYLTARGDYPWNIQAGCTTPNGATSLASLPACTTALVNDNELKSDFGQNPDLSRIYPNFVAASNVFIICFTPQSRSQQNDGNVKYNRDGTVNATKNCNTQSSTNGCYWCLQ